TGSLRFVNTTTRRGDDVIGIARIYIDREDVGVVDDSVLDRLPGLTTISRLVRQIESTGVDRVGRARIDGQRLNVKQAGHVSGWQWFPVVAGVVGTEDRIERAGDQRVWIRIRLSERVNRLVFQLLVLFPGHAAVS